MLEAAVEAAAGAAERPWLLGSRCSRALDEDEDLAAIGVAAPPAEQALRLGGWRSRPGSTASACSPREIAVLRNCCTGPRLVVPGIRPAGGAGDDQKRTMGRPRRCGWGPT